MNEIDLIKMCFCIMGYLNLWFIFWKDNFRIVLFVIKIYHDRVLNYIIWTLNSGLNIFLPFELFKTNLKPRILYNSKFLEGKTTATYEEISGLHLIWASSNFLSTRNFARLLICSFRIIIPSFSDKIISDANSPWENSRKMEKSCVKEYRKCNMQFMECVYPFFVIAPFILEYINECLNYKFK